MASRLLSRILGDSNDKTTDGDPAAAGSDETVVAFFTGDHRACDGVWAAVETAADGGDADAVKATLAAFDAKVRRHLAMEEEVLFPAFEEATGMHGAGPTVVMRMEHQQMRALLDTMGKAAETGNIDDVLGHGDTLLMLIQQHNRKEEGMLYPMADNALGEAWQKVREDLRRFDR